MISKIWPVETKSKNYLYYQVEYWLFKAKEKYLETREFKGQVIYVNIVIESNWN